MLPPDVDLCAVIYGAHYVVCLRFFKQSDRLWTLILYVPVISVFELDVYPDCQSSTQTIFKLEHTTSMLSRFHYYP